jgi:hypothetical protein
MSCHPASGDIMANSGVCRPGTDYDLHGRFRSDLSVLAVRDVYRCCGVVGTSDFDLGTLAV